MSHIGIIKVFNDKLIIVKEFSIYNLVDFDKDFFLNDDKIKEKTPTCKIQLNIF